MADCNTLHTSNRGIRLVALEKKSRSRLQPTLNRVAGFTSMRTVRKPKRTFGGRILYHLQQFKEKINSAYTNVENPKKDHISFSKARMGNQRPAGCIRPAGFFYLARATFSNYFT